MKILRGLEELKLIRLHKEESRDTKIPLRPSQLRGSISKATTNQLLRHIEQSRHEWE